MNIVITEGGSTKNIGSAALIENAIKIAQQTYPNCKIAVLCQQPLIVKEFVQSDVDTATDLFIVPKVTGRNSVLWLVETLLWLVYYYIVRTFTKKPAIFMSGQKKQTLKLIQEADLIYCIGAERINDIYFKTAYISLEALSIFQGLGKRLVHLSLTIGPIFHKSTISKAKKVLDNSYAIFVRDQKSFDILEQLKIRKPLIFNSFDIALLQSQESSNEMKKMLQEKGIDLSKPIIGVSVLFWKFRNAESDVRQSGYNLAIAETLDHIRRNLKYQVLFTPTVINGRINDDVHVSHQIYDLMKEKNEVYFIDELLNPKQLSTVFSLTRFSIVTRMHAAILCSSAGSKPVISINYLYKLREYMKSIDFEEYSIDIDRTNSKDLISFVSKMEQNYSSNKQKLNNRINEMQLKLKSDLNKIAIQK